MLDELFLNFPMFVSSAQSGRDAYYRRLGEGERYKVGPFYCARSNQTHRQMPDGNDYSYAVDFIVGKGTPVLAVLEGQIVAITDTYTEFGIDKSFRGKLNEVVIKHTLPNGDVFFTQYAHIENGSVTDDFSLRVGNIVSTGQTIGRVGANGQMIFDQNKGPLYHLHFMAFHIKNEKIKTIKVSFRGKLYFLFKQFIVNLLSKRA